MGFAMSDDSMSLIEAAELEGLKERNLLSGLMARLNPVLDSAAKVLTQGVVSLKTANPTDPKNLAYESILKRLQQSSETNVWLLVDDIDAKYVDTPEQQARIGAFFSALRSLAHAVEGLRVRATVRTDVWTNIRGMEDQDKLRQYLTDITWSDEHLRGIFSKKILSYFQREVKLFYDSLDEHKDYRKIIKEVFSEHFKIGQDNNGDPLVVAMMLAGKRPRWMGQLCKLAGAAAEGSVIEQRHFDHVMSDFGKEKISDLIKEHRHQFTELEKVLDSFRLSEKTNSKNKLLQIINRGFVSKMTSAHMPNVNGYPYKSVDQIAELLYEIDFIVGEKAGKQTAFQHDPNLFKCELNSQNKVPWMVNLSYRKFLGIQ
jgi:hypothetical protein